MLKAGSHQNSPLIKGYACIFVCFATKAVHIDLVNGQSTQDFIQALNRFLDCRGIRTRIYLDNAMNFVEANRYLKEV